MNKKVPVLHMQLYIRTSANGYTEIMNHKVAKKKNRNGNLTDSPVSHIFS